MNHPANALPGWGTMPKRPGFHLLLNRGRDLLQHIVKTQGFAGPKIGLLLHAQTLYAQKVPLRFKNSREAKRFFPDTTLSINSVEVIEGTLAYDGKCYGNWNVCYIAPGFFSK